MLYEVQTVDVRPHTLGEAERRLAVALARSSAGPALAGSFRTEIGPLNRIILIWCHDTGTSDPPARFVPEDIADLVIGERSDFFAPLPISPVLTAGEFGPFYEIRTYAYENRDLPDILAAWSAALPERLRLGPVLAVWRSREGAPGRLLHIWPYRTLDDRAEVRRRARASGMWPPLAAARMLGLPEYRFLHQENAIAVPLPFSPLQ